MDQENAMLIMEKSYKAYEILLELIPQYVPLLENHEDKNDIEARLNRGIFESAHCIMNTIHHEIFREYPELQKEFIARMDKKHSKQKE